MLRAGIWASRRQLIAALRMPGSRGARIHLRVERTRTGRADLAEYLARDPYIEVVVPDPLHRFDPIAHHLHLRGVLVWIAPVAVLDDIVDLLGVGPTASVAIAAGLARLPASPRFRPALRSLPPPDPRQLALPLPHYS